MREDIEIYVRSCEECQADKPNLHPRTPPPMVTDTPEAPFLKLSCDLTGPLPVTNKNSRYVFVANDLFSKKIYACPLPDKKSSSTVEALKSIVYSNPRLPREVLTDNGLEFEGSFSLWLEENGIKHLHTSPYHPQSNGVTERSNATLKGRLKAFRHGNWESRLREMVHQINLTPSESTGLSPFAIETGFDGVNPKCPVDVKDTVREETIAELQKLVRERLTKEKESRSSKKGRYFVPFSKGDRVLLKAKSGSIRYIGPFEIIEVFSDGYAYQLKSLEDGSEYRRRVELLKPYVAREHEQIEPQKTEEESLEDHHGLGSCGLEDFDLPLKPNSGRMWPILAPQPSTPSSISASDSPTSPSVSELDGSTAEESSPSPQVEALPPSSMVPVTPAAPVLNAENDLVPAVVESSVTEEMISHHEELSKSSMNIEDLSVKEEVVIGDSVSSVSLDQTVVGDDGSSASLDETIVGGHPENVSNEEMNSHLDVTPPVQDIVDMETSEQIPTMIQADIHMQTVNEPVVPVVANPEAVNVPSVSRREKRRPEVEPEDIVERRSSKRLKTKVKVLEDCSDSVIASEKTYIGGGDIPVASLRTMLKTRTEIVELCLVDASEYQLEVIKKKYAVPDDYKTNREVSDYLRGLNPLGLSLKQLRSDWWAVVPVEFSFDPKHSIPEQCESNGGYCL